MFSILLTMFAGTGAGYLLRKLPATAYSGKALTAAIWIMLFSLGTETGSDRNLIANISTIGFQAAIFAFAGGAGSIAGAMLLSRFIHMGRPGRTDSGHHNESTDTRSAQEKGEGGGLTGTFAVLAFFLAGCLAGWAGLVPEDIREMHITSVILYIMMFLAGITIGSNPDLSEIIRNIRPGLILLPIASIAGCLIMTSAIAFISGKWSLPECLATGSGMGYYSLSSILIFQYKEPTLGTEMAAELGTIALLANVFRELGTLVAIPLIVRKCGAFAAIASAGATAMDVCLPVILKYSGSRYLPAAVISGIVSDFSVPVLVTFFCSL